MTGTLKVTPEELRSTAAAFASCGSEVKNNTAQMLALVAGISQVSGRVLHMPPI